MYANYNNLWVTGGEKMLSVIIPAYGIIPNTKDLKYFLRDIEHEVIVQHDIFGDGKGFTLQEGFKRTKGDIICWLDADMEVSPSQIPGMLNLMKMHEADVVVGSKAHECSSVVYPFTRWIISVCGRWIVQLLFHLPIKDTQTGLKIFKRAVLTENVWKVRGFGHDVEVLVRAYQSGRKMIEAPVVIIKTEKSTVNLWNVLVTLKEVLWLRLKIK